jgi:hypothetical protein
MYLRYEAITPRELHWKYVFKVLQLYPLNSQVITQLLQLSNVETFNLFYLFPELACKSIGNSKSHRKYA